MQWLLKLGGLLISFYFSNFNNSPSFKNETVRNIYFNGFQSMGTIKGSFDVMLDRSSILASLLSSTNMIPTNMIPIVYKESIYIHYSKLSIFAFVT